MINILICLFYSLKQLVIKKSRFEIMIFEELLYSKHARSFIFWLEARRGIRLTRTEVQIFKIQIWKFDVPWHSGHKNKMILFEKSLPYCWPMIFFQNLYFVADTNSQKIFVSTNSLYKFLYPRWINGFEWVWIEYFSPFDEIDFSLIHQRPARWQSTTVSTIVMLQKWHKRNNNK